MKYFTKEWYALCQKTSFHLGLEEEEQGERFSEEYFQRLYHTELQRWLTLQEEVAALMKHNTTDHMAYEPFHRDQAIEQFHDRFVFQQEYLRRELPQSIINQIADIRVFALHKATRTVINAVADFCEENERSAAAASENYRKYIEVASSAIDQEILENFGFHDCTITTSIQEDMSLTLCLDNSGGVTTIDKVTFTNMKIIKQDGELVDSWWLYDEIYKVNDHYEFHVLLQNSKAGLIDFIIAAEQISFHRSVDSPRNEGMPANE